MEWCLERARLHRLMKNSCERGESVERAFRLASIRLFLILGAGFSRRHLTSNDKKIRIRARRPSLLKKSKSRFLAG